MSTFDWSHGRTLLAIIESGSLSAAARRLGMTQPTARRHLEALEAAVGGPLFVRSPRGLVATPLAERLHPRVRALSDEAEAFMRAAAHGSAEQTTVRITASRVVATCVLPDILARLRPDAPEIDIELVASDETQNLLHRGADIAIRMAQPKQGNVVARRVASVPLGLFAARSWLDAHAEPRTLEEAVSTRALIAPDRDPYMLDTLAALGIEAGREDFALRCDDTVVHAAAARAGLGIAVMQVPLATRDTSLVRVVPDFGLALPVWLAIAPGMQRAAGVRTVADALAAGLAGYVRGG